MAEGGEPGNNNDNGNKESEIDHKVSRKHSYFSVMIDTDGTAVN
jgi:hypothetical protein